MITGWCSRCRAWCDHIRITAWVEGVGYTSKCVACGSEHTTYTEYSREEQRAMHEAAMALKDDGDGVLGQMELGV